MVPNHPLDHVDFERKVAVFQNEKTKQLEEVPPSLSPLLFFFYCRFDALPLFAYLRFSFPYRSPTRRCGDPMVATARSVVRSSGSPTRPRRPSSSAPATWSLRFSLTRTVPSSISFCFFFLFSIILFSFLYLFSFFSLIIFLLSECFLFSLSWFLIRFPFSLTVISFFIGYLFSHYFVFDGYLFSYYVIILNRFSALQGAEGVPRVAAL